MRFRFEKSQRTSAIVEEIGGGASDAESALPTATDTSLPEAGRSSKKPEGTQPIQADPSDFMRVRIHPLEMFKLSESASPRSSPLGEGLPGPLSLSLPKTRPPSLESLTDPPSQLERVDKPLLPGPPFPDGPDPALLKSSGMTASVALLDHKGDWLEFSDLAFLSLDCSPGFISAQAVTQLGLPRAEAPNGGIGVLTPRGPVKCDWCVPVWCSLKLWDLPQLLILLPIVEKEVALSMGVTVVFGKEFIRHCFGDSWLGIPLDSHSEPGDSGAGVGERTPDE
jgi:hypothetical protein